MKIALRRRLILTALTAASMCASAALPAAGVERGPQRRVSAATVETEARVIVKFKADSALMRALAVGSAPALPQHAQALSARLGLSLTDGRVVGPSTQVLKSKGLSSQQLADRLAAQGDVEYAEVDQRMHALAAPSDPLYASGQTTATPAVGQWYLHAPTSATIVNANSVVSSINVEPAWAITTGSSSVVVAVLDTGVRKDHPDFAGKLLPGYDFIADVPTSNDSDGRDADASDPGDFGCGETTSSWHGTQTAGLIGAATNNGLGMASVGRNVMLLPIRVLGCGGGFSSDIQAAMRWAVGIDVAGVPHNTTPAKVLNLSLGAPGACSGLYADTIAQVNAVGAVVVVAGGNEGLDVGTPANCTGAIAVAGVRHSGSKVGYSDLGPAMAIAAPAGNCVNGAGLPCLYPLLTTSNSGLTTPMPGAAGATYTGGGDDASLGTSFSSPLVAGVAALMYSANSTLTPAQVLAALKSSARPFPATGFDPAVKACTAPTTVAQNTECYCTTTTCGAGLLDAGAAVAAVAVVTANITASASTAVVGDLVTFDGSASRPSAGNLRYQWSITPATGLATIKTATDASSMTLETSAAGNVTVTLTVTDDASKTATTTSTLAITTAPAPAPASSGGGGGGGAMDLGWLLGWLASVIGVWVVTPRSRRR
ncbi:MAG: S8 family serine peptidase [Burkholderiales bacterium]